MTRSSREKPVSEALQLQGRATEIIRRIDTPEKAAEFYVNTQEAYGAASEIMRHVKSMLMLEARERPVETGGQFVVAEPSDYSYDIAAVKELAADCIKTVEVPTSDKMQAIHKYAGELLENVILGTMSQDDVAAHISSIVLLSQPETYEAVDGNKLRAVLGRGDERAAKLMARRVKTPTAWKLVIKEGANANR